MVYTKSTMRDALQQVSDLTSWEGFWEKAKGTPNPYLIKQRMKAGVSGTSYSHSKFREDIKRFGALSFRQELLEYCWCVYSKALEATGPLLIGREADLKPYLQKVANLDPSGSQTLFNRGTRGNIQMMDKWAPVVNDCWILGGVHRKADFDLYSPRALDNLWDRRGERFVVTAREILGLLRFGYVRRLAEIPANEPGEPAPRGRAWARSLGRQVKFVCEKAVHATTASLENYTRLIAEKEAQKSSAVLELSGLREDVASEIRAFRLESLTRTGRAGDLGYELPGDAG